MDVYIYCADIYCEDCGEAAKRLILRTAKAPADTGDSDDYPQGPYSDGGGEADTPQHCGDCGVFLGNELTGDGEDYVTAAIREAYSEAEAGLPLNRELYPLDLGPVIKEWEDFYDYLLANEED